MKTIADLLREHPLLGQLPLLMQESLAGCAQVFHAKAGSYIAQSSDPANYFYLLRSGVALVEIFVPSEGPKAIMSLSSGQLIGWSWIFPPYLWTFDIRAQSDIGAIAFHGKCLRDKCEEDPRLGYQFMKIFSRVMSERLHATRMQIVDLYGK